MTLLHLCSGKNKEGYWHALFKSFDAEGAPVKSSLSKFRSKISYQFFEDHLFTLLNSIKRPTWRGLHVYATDGFEVAIPRSEEILNTGFRGRRVKIKSKNLVGETYYPHLHMVHTFDVLAGVTKTLSVSIQNNEIAGALENLPKLERNSITIYDRFYSVSKIMNAHFHHKNYFLIRCRKGFGVPKEITEFFKSKNKRDSFLLNKDPDKRIFLYKIKRKNQKEPWILATNKADLGSDAAESLYQKRWEVENSFRDLTETLKIEQWHSKNTNGILQEIYMRFWIMNFAKSQQISIEKPKKKPFSKIYFRSNFKLILDFMVINWNQVFKKSKSLLQLLKKLISRSVEKRKRYSLSKPRQIKFNPSNHRPANIIFDQKIENGEKSP